ncbi:MAG: magnesium chelatase subunit D [Pseudomonadota bacterium]
MTGLSVYGDKTPGEPAAPSFARGADLWDDAVLAAQLLSIDPFGLRGACLRAFPGPPRDQWFALFRAGAKLAPVVKLPLGADDARIIGGLDLAATLRAGKPVMQRGLLAEANGGVLLVSMAERLRPSVSGLIASAVDLGAVVVERDGFSTRMPARFCTILYDEGADAGEAAPQALLDRVAFHLNLDGVSLADMAHGFNEPSVNAHWDWRDVVCSDEIAEAINAASLRLGVRSLSALHFAVRAAIAHAALYGRASVSDEDAAIACRLVIGPRMAPAIELTQETAPPERSQQSDADTDNDDAAQQKQDDISLEDVLVAAAQAGAIALMQRSGGMMRRRDRAAGGGGRSGAVVASRDKGRPVGSRKDAPRAGRIDIAATLRAAAPWQGVRRKGDQNRYVVLDTEDVQIKRYQARAESLVIFCVDASGSSAIRRMGEAKGAVERLLADCYSRRDYVALIAFGGERADLILPPTRSLVRARRALIALPGGGGTPLAAGVAASTALADLEARKGKTPIVVVLSDGRGNIAFDGGTDRDAAENDAQTAARKLRALGVQTLFFDTSTRPSPRARAIAESMGADYRPLPFAASETISKAVRSAVEQS